MSAIVLSTINAKWIHPSYALRLLKANLGPLEGEAVILEFALRQPLAEKVAAILAAKPRILALSVSIWNHAATIELLDALEEYWSADSQAPTPEGGKRPVHGRPANGPRPVIVMGGPEVSWLNVDAPILRRTDWLIRGEGEHAFRELCAALLANREPDFAPSVASRTGPGGRIIEALPIDLAGIDRAYRLYSDEDLARKLTYMEASRGCPFGCRFCLSARDRSVRTVALDDFLSDMEDLIARGAKSFKFLDRTFNLDIERARTILEFFLERLEPGMFVHFEMVPARFPLELRELLTRFKPGTLRLEIGIQTFNPAVAKAIHRASDPERELETLRFLREHTKAIVHADLIAGLPGEDFASFGAGFNRLWRERPGEIQLGVLKRLPGTPLAENDDGALYQKEPPYEVIETPSLSREELDRLKNFARFWELIINRGHFDALIPRLLPHDETAFEDFMAHSDALLASFSRNWGIDRAALREALEERA